ncbi:hypothetical protein ACG2QI_00800 [Bacillus sp. GM2]|uniref:Uncharacterized protein n=1 Tax=Bacillus paralicheniformis TaxID=1648923 RepID=A0A7Z1B537_9BACI|nr:MULTISPECIES: hypothetical protein [Bacillus]ETB71674.1 molecular chaperone DnaJ [Bacillus sp. CPSM8]MBC8621451.1 hypothetical protein [Robertmurraya crescens]ARC60533.1 hypothetical protein BaDB11_01892 [Bacillus licheniformis]KUL11649.1 molecular chaperone DnaJ [Bacillus licheniformis LMG 17339]MBL7476249.1 hypothetical protein [Bacillus paralicheniformis]
MDKKHNYFIPSGLLIGLGIGILFDHPAPGLLIGLGAGILLSAVVPKRNGK